MKILRYILLPLLFLPLSTLAATISLLPVVGEFREGQVFTVNVGVNPQGRNLYTTKVELIYPTGLLEVQSFAFANGWMPLSQPGYDSIDNQNGALVKTAGYPSGLSTQANFGMVTFRVKAKGSAIVKLGSNSLALDANNQNSITNFSSQAVFTLLEKAVSAPTNPPPQPEKTTVDTEKATVGGVPSEQALETEPGIENLQTAAISQAAFVSYGVWLTILAVTLIFFGGGFILGRKTGILSSYFERR